MIDHKYFQKPLCSKNNCGLLPIVMRQAKRNPGTLRITVTPDYASLHPGYKTIAPSRNALASQASRNDASIASSVDARRQNAIAHSRASACSRAYVGMAIGGVTGSMLSSPVFTLGRHVIGNMSYTGASVRAGLSTSSTKNDRLPKCISLLPMNWPNA